MVGKSKNKTKTLLSIMFVVFFVKIYTDSSKFSESADRASLERFEKQLGSRQRRNATLVSAPTHNDIRHNPSASLLDCLEAVFPIA